MKNLLTYCIIGAGNGGLAMAAYIASKGYRVNLYNRSEERIKLLKKNPTLYLKGEEKGKGKLNKVTSDIRDAIIDADIIMVTIPAIGHNYIAEKMAPHLRDGQIIILNPGRTGGALEVYETLLRKRRKNNITVGEAQTFIYAARAENYNKVHIYKTKKEVSLATIPATKTKKVVSLLNHVYPQFSPATDVLETSINNYGAIFHPAPTILNSGHIERGVPFDYYMDGITESVGRYLEKMDQERIEIGKTLGVKVISSKDWLEETYGAKGKSIHEAVQNNPGYKNLKAPTDIHTRYLLEDVPYSLVPLESIAHTLKIKVPAITNIINISEILLEKDFRKIGRTAKCLGLDGLTINEMHLLAREGRICRRRLKGVI